MATLSCLIGNVNATLTDEYTSNIQSGNVRCGFEMLCFNTRKTLREPLKRWKVHFKLQLELYHFLFSLPCLTSIINMLKHNLSIFQMVSTHNTLFDMRFNLDWKVSFSHPLVRVHILEFGSLSLIGIFDGNQREIFFEKCGARWH